ncbi:MAG: RNA polymerase sigma factor [Planctomycetota bacterium]
MATPAEPSNAPDDQSLIAAAHNGDQSALATLLTRHESRMFGLCFRIVHHRELAADLCQDAMVKIINGLDGYDGRAQFTTWLTRIVINVCLSKLRSEKLRKHASLDAQFGGSSGATASQSDSTSSLSRTIRQSREQTPSSRVEENEGRQALLTALSNLDPEQRTILLLRDQRGLDYDEIGDVLGIAVGTVKSRLFRARAALREMVERLSPDQDRDSNRPGIKAAKD